MTIDISRCERLHGDRMEQIMSTALSLIHFYYASNIINVLKLECCAPVTMQLIRC